MKATAYIALGSNLGDRRANIEQALRCLAGIIDDSRVSSIYETDPVGYADQPRFLNAVVTGTTARAPVPLLHDLLSIEDALGRRRSFPNAPRTLDLDLLLFDDLVIETPELCLPHPRLHERAFVLVPLVELAPDLRHPRLARTMQELLTNLAPSPPLRPMEPRAQDQSA